ncbi:N-acetylmuramoyl-L-alanine amidase [Candidatus Saccharibacteria bacterium]|nr:N-acetylmuramoyl-L-alanine amidase [Candidatus Saccharibacteria bacterium]
MKTSVEVEVDGAMEYVPNEQLTRRQFIGLGEIGPEAVAAPEVWKHQADWKKRSIGFLAIAAFTIAFNTRPMNDVEATMCDETDMACQLEEMGEVVPQTMRLGPIDAPAETTTTLPPTTSTETTVTPPTTTTNTTTIPLAPPETAPVIVPEIIVEPAPINVQTFFNPEVQPVSPEAKTAIEAMDLTVEGYQNFFNTIDQSWFDYAQSYANFSPTNSGIAQNATEWVTAHFTASYNNSDGTADQPVGEMNVRQFIDLMGNRGRPCCGINFIIDRNGRVIQTAPYNAKLRHDPPGDGRSVGFEVEAAQEKQMTTEQYESAAYLTIAILENEAILVNRPLNELFRGHGEMRDQYREQNPGTDLEQRNDFDAAIMEIYRPEITAFINNTPDLRALTGVLR